MTRWEYITHNVVLNVANIAYNVTRFVVIMIHWALDR